MKAAGIKVVAEGTAEPRPGGHDRAGIRDYHWNRRTPAKGRRHRNNLRELLMLADCTEVEAAAAIWGTDRSAQSLLNRYKNGAVMPSVATAWVIVRGMEQLLGRPVRFEEVFPREAVLGGR